MEERKLCPFKKTVERCMAYSKGKCQRLKMMEQPMERRR